MAEHSFQEVMREWTRMCNAVPGKAEHRNLCSDKESGYVCPLRKNGLCNLSIAEQTNEDWAEGEHIIMSWAADHPEPVYPTWLEWLHTTSAVDGTPDIPVGDGIKFRVTIKNEPIPANIVQKLGIEPKEK